MTRNGLTLRRRVLQSGTRLNSFCEVSVVATAAKMMVDARVAVLEALRKEELLSTDLMDYLERDKQLSDETVRSVILDLLKQAKIEFGPNQKLRVRVPEAKPALQERT